MLQRITYLVVGLGDTGKDDLIRRKTCFDSRFDLTAAFGLQFQYSDFRLFGGYRLGLTDLNSNDNIKTTSSGLFVGLGYSL